jgi:copper chaperone CopZ
MRTQDLSIEGMTCGHCVMHVKKELSKVSDLVVEDVQIGKARVRYEENKVTLQQIDDAVSEAGYKLVSAQ